MRIPQNFWSRLFLLMLLIGTTQNLFSQTPQTSSPKTYKNQFYIYWGWNRGFYSNSDIHFHGNSYDFTLANVAAKDNQNPVGIDPYLAPLRLTIPQTNVRIGYFITDHWSLSLGLDHMKYVMLQDQSVAITGSIQQSNTNYDGVYHNDPITLRADFLQFEHTDGLNYINAEVRRLDNLINLRRFHLPNIDINLTEGFGLGVLLPKTNTTLLGNAQYDEFHLTGYGISSFVGLNITFFEHFFIQSELKGGYINMPDIRTTLHASDRADQHFFFGQANLVVGANFTL